MHNNYIDLNDGHTMPPIGIGTWSAQGRTTLEVMVNAIHNGYRMFDSAQQYNNEQSLGEAIRVAGIDRRELFLTTKVAGANQGSELTTRSIEDSLTRFGTDYLDLVLIHWPNMRQGVMIQTWEALITCKNKGMIKSIGTSNFLPEHIMELADATSVLPSVNQIQLDPFLQRVPEREFHAKHHIITQSWGPFATRAFDKLAEQPNLALDHLTLQRIADDAGMTMQDLILAWMRTQRVVPLPRSFSNTRQQSNLEAFNQELSSDIIAAIADVRECRAHYLDPHTYEEW